MKSVEFAVLTKIAKETGVVNPCVAVDEQETKLPLEATTKQVSVEVELSPAAR